MPLRDTSKMDLVIQGEPSEITAARKEIVNSFADLEFIDEGHQYILHHEDGRDENLISVSVLCSRFINPFDTDTVAAAYALKNGETPEYWKDVWAFNNLCSTTTGTYCHSYAESYGWLKAGHPELITEDCIGKYIKDRGWLIPTRPKEEAAKKCLDELDSNLHLVMNETKVYTTKYKLNFAGTFDVLRYYKDPKDDSRSGFVIMDWKTNKSLYDKYKEDKNVRMKFPFEDFIDEDFYHYTVQLSAYQIALEDMLGIKIIARRIIWLKPDGNYELIPVPDVTEKLRDYLGEK